MASLSCAASVAFSRMRPACCCRLRPISRPWSRRLTRSGFIATSPSHGPTKTLSPPSRRPAGSISAPRTSDCWPRKLAGRGSAIRRRPWKNYGSRPMSRALPMSIGRPTALCGSTIASGNRPASGGCAFGGSLVDWQHNPEGRALADGAGHFDAPAVALDDAVGDGQAKAGAEADRLCGVEGFENPLDLRRIHAAAGVGNLDPGMFVVGTARADGDGAAPVVAGHRLGRVDQDVQEDLAYLRRQAFDLR